MGMTATPLEKTRGVSTMDVLSKLGNEGLIPVIVIENADDAANTAKALLDGGLGVMEITMRTPAGVDAIRNVKKACPEMLTGAGTVLTLEKAKESVDAGAEFIVTPGFNDDIVDWCLKNNIAVTPGCVTPTEIEHALSFGLTVLKFFPASVFGGLEGMKALNGPFGTVSFIPTGGVSESNLGEYSDKPYIHAIGGGFLAKTPDIKNGKFEEITRTAAAAINTLLGFDIAHVGINCGSASQSEQLCMTLGSAFGFGYNPGNASNFAGKAIEITKETGLGANGHLAVRTNNISRAIYHLHKRGFEVDPSTAKEKDGRMIAIYLRGEFGGFAIHLLQK